MNDLNSFGNLPTAATFSLGQQKTQIEMLEMSKMNLENIVSEVDQIDTKVNQALSDCQSLQDRKLTL